MSDKRLLVPASLATDGGRPANHPDSGPVPLLDALDRALRAFVAAHPEVAVALFVDESLTSAILADAQVFMRRLELALGEAAASLPDPPLLFVQAEQRGRATAGIRIAAPDIDSVVGRFCWPCCWRELSE